MPHALVVIDIQNDYFPGGAFPLENAEAACQGAVEAIAQARQAGWLVVGVQHIGAPEAPFFRPETDGVRFHPAISEALGDAPVVAKAQADSFFNTPLETLLQEAGITDLHVTGMMTQHCVTHTALSPQARGLTVHVVAKGCAAPTQLLSNIALSGLGTRCRVA